MSWFEAQVYVSLAVILASLIGFVAYTLFARALLRIQQQQRLEREQLDAYMATLVTSPGTELDHVSPHTAKDFYDKLRYDHPILGLYFAGKRKDPYSRGQRIYVLVCVIMFSIILSVLLSHSVCYQECHPSDYCGKMRAYCEATSLCPICDKHQNEEQEDSCLNDNKFANWSLIFRLLGVQFGTYLLQRGFGLPCLRTRRKKACPQICTVLGGLGVLVTVYVIILFFLIAPCWGWFEHLDVGVFAISVPVYLLITLPVMTWVKYNLWGDVYVYRPQPFQSVFIGDGEEFSEGSDDSVDLRPYTTNSDKTSQPEFADDSYFRLDADGTDAVAIRSSGGHPRQPSSPSSRAYAGAHSLSPSDLRRLHNSPKSDYGDGNKLNNQVGLYKKSGRASGNLADGNGIVNERDVLVSGSSSSTSSSASAKPRKVHFSDKGLLSSSDSPSMAVNSTRVGSGREYGLVFDGDAVPTSNTRIRLGQAKPQPLLPNNAYKSRYRYN